MFKYLASLLLAMVVCLAPASAEVVRTPNHVGGIYIAWVAQKEGGHTSCYLGHNSAYEPLLHASKVNPRWSAVKVRESAPGSLLGFRPGADGKLTTYTINSCDVGSIIVMPAHKVEYDRTGNSGGFAPTSSGEAPPTAVLVEAASL